MKKIFILLALVILMAVSVNAQIPSKPFSIYGSGSLDLVSANEGFKELHKAGYNFSGGVGISIAPMIQVVGKVEYHSILKDWDLAGIGGFEFSEYVDGGTVSMWTYGPDVRLTVGAPMVPIKPFFLAGFGWASLSEAEINIVDNPFISNVVTIEEGTKFYFNVGGGLEFGSGPLSFFMQVRYLNVKQDNADNLVFIPVSLGLKF